MQERRTAVRLEYVQRAQYCTSNRLQPLDGRVTNVSAGGAGLLVREPYRSGDCLTVSFPLPGEEDPLTASGTVRWADPSVLRGRWHRVGMEWLPLEETAQHRLQTFLHSRVTSASRTPLGPDRQGGVSVRQLRMSLGAVFGILVGTLLSLWLAAVQRENRELAFALQQRNTIIRQLEQDQRRLEGELAGAKANLATMEDSLARLSGTTPLLGGELHRLNQEVDLFQQSYARVREERDRLLRQVRDFEQGPMVRVHEPQSP